MLPINFPTTKFKTILCLGAHCDDIEIGCGGSILRLAAKYHDISVYWIVFSSNAVRKLEAIQSADLFLRDVSSKEVVIENFRNGYFPYIGAEIKEYFERLKERINPDLIFTHFRHDLHQDHRIISELTWNTFRDHLILEYEIAKYDGDLGSPNLFIQLSEELKSRKVEFIMECFKSQADKQWFTADSFGGLMRLRGIESCAVSGFSEAFYCRKIVI